MAPASRSRVDGDASDRRTRHQALWLALAAALLPVCVSASVSIYVGKNLTKDGHVLLAGWGDEPSSHWLEIVPRREYPQGATIKVGGTAAADLPGELIDIPQAHETYRYIAMTYSYFKGLAGPLVNGGLNEYGVAVNDVAVHCRPELIAMTSKQQHGLNYSDVARIALERAHTAREALDVSIALIEKYGDFTYGGNSHVFADANEGWVLLTFPGGKGLWVAHRLGPNDVWFNWRGIQTTGYVQELPQDWRKSGDYLASSNFVSFAEKHGWYKARPGEPLRIMAVYGGPNLNPTRELSAAEVVRIQADLRAAAPKIDVPLLMRELHSAARDSSGYGQVAQLSPDVDPDLRTLWVAPGPPITAAFIPWRLGVASILPEYQRHRYLTAGEAERGVVEPEFKGVESTHFADRAVKRLLYLVDEHREAFLPDVTAALDAFATREFTSQGDVERTAQILLAAHERGLANRYLTEQANTAAADGLRLIEALADDLEARTKALYGIRPTDRPAP
jgi:dipeptidase